MNIIELMTVVRSILYEHGVPEMPAFPASLYENWCHPDLFLSVKGNGLGPCFMLQPFIRHDGLFSASSVKTPDLVWLVSPDKGKEVLFNRAFKFLRILNNKLENTGKRAAFSLTAGSHHKQKKGMAGVYWNIRLNGVRCGRVSLYSKLPGTEIKEGGAVIVTLQLNKISIILSDCRFCEAAPWVGKVRASSSMAMQAWQQLDDESAEVKSIDFADFLTMPDDKPRSCINKFCKLFRIYNNHGRIINEKEGLYEQLEDVLKKLSDRIISMGPETFRTLEN